VPLIYVQPVALIQYAGETYPELIGYPVLAAVPSPAKIHGAWMHVWEYEEQLVPVRL
jgi:hypothetical protein